MDVLVDSVFRGLFGVMDPLGMILRTLMALLADALAKLITGAYGQLFELTTVDFAVESVSNIWRITTGLSAGLATVLLVVAAFRSMLAQSNSYLLAALPGVVVAVLGPQALAVFLPFLAAALTDLAQVIVASATPDLAQSMRLLAGVGSNPIYEGLGLLAPLIAATMLFGLIAVFVVLLFCMAGAMVLFVMSPFAFAGQIPTREGVRDNAWTHASRALGPGGQSPIIYTPGLPPRIVSPSPRVHTVLWLDRMEASPPPIARLDDRIAYVLQAKAGMAAAAASEARLTAIEHRPPTRSATLTSARPQLGMAV